MGRCSSGCVPSLPKAIPYNLIFRFTSRKVSRRESVGRLVFVKVRDYEVMNIFIKPQTSSKDR